MNHGAAIALQHISLSFKFEKGFEERLFFAMPLESHLAAMLKEIAHTPGLSEVAAVFAEGQTNLGRRAVSIVAECFHKDSHALRAISLVAD
jgi:hypothetical protein